MIEEPGEGAIEEWLREPVDGAARKTFQRHPTADSERAAAEHSADAEGPGPTTSPNENPLVPDGIVSALEAPDPQSFLLALANALVRSPHTTADGESSLGTILRQLGNALDEELDEESAFQDLVDALEHRRFGARALREAIPIVAAFLARIVSGPARETGSAAMPAEIASLVRVAAQVARDALGSAGVRGWRALPEITATIARRAAQRNLSIGTLAELLPRLSTRLGPEPREGSTTRSGHFQARATGEPRRMVLSGPVEIVILER
jgi:hypothetical protein